MSLGLRSKYSDFITERFWKFIWSQSAFGKRDRVGRSQREDSNQNIEGYQHGYSAASSHSLRMSFVSTLLGNWGLPAVQIMIGYASVHPTTSYLL